MVPPYISPWTHLIPMNTPLGLHLVTTCDLCVIDRLVLRLHARPVGR